ncbi:hypothetical protein ACSQ76_07580 [Roseovarius sp. B08]|uniref:hypothetical protein n=1 Tax=Roseovarius sp. B08 TaxID=3449223 RepID=UPI003EDBD14E
MATPPRNDQHDAHMGATGSKRSRLPMYIGVVVIVLLLIFLLFGNVFSPEEAVVSDDDQTIETTETGNEDGAVTGTATSTPETETDGAANDAAGTDAATGTATSTPETETGGAANDTADAGTDASDLDSEESAEEVIEIEGDADVEIVDDTQN